MVLAADDGSITFTFNRFRPYDLLYPPRPASASGMSSVPVLGATTDIPATDAEDAVNEDPSLVPNTVSLPADFVADVFEDHTIWDLPRTITDIDGTAERNNEVPDDAHLACCGPAAAFWYPAQACAVSAWSDGDRPASSAAIWGPG